MVLDNVRSILGMSAEPQREAQATTEQTDTDTSDTSSNVLSRPPGWDALMRTFEKPVYPVEEREVREIIEGLDKASKLADFDCLLPAMGTNDEHIQLHLYTVRNESAEDRVLVVDVHINEFDTWLPEDGVTDNGHEWTYPTDSLTSCGPYYMELAHNLGEVLRINDMKYSLVEYDEDADYAIFSAEIFGYWNEEQPLGGSE